MEMHVLRFPEFKYPKWSVYVYMVSLAKNAKLYETEITFLS